MGPWGSGRGCAPCKARPGRARTRCPPLRCPVVARPPRNDLRRAPAPRRRGWIQVPPLRPPTRPDCGGGEALELAPRPACRATLCVLGAAGANPDECWRRAGAGVGGGACASGVLARAVRVSRRKAVSGGWSGVHGPAASDLGRRGRGRAGEKAPGSPSPSTKGPGRKWEWAIGARTGRVSSGGGSRRGPCGWWVAPAWCAPKVRVGGSSAVYVRELREDGAAGEVCRRKA